MFPRVEGRDKSPPNRDEHVAGDVIGITLAIHDELAGSHHGLPAFEHVAQRLGPRRDDIGMPRQKFEEAAFLRHQSMEPTKH